ncbi:hypothetical protein HIM_04597 [Hirsutella minnesotensis 3608]|uniref:Sugar phosphate transporter domain-containing protein n=1 Tax=Hirsutella minnesotensis 3608 TaxID=1043627 RepID=A0A0F7ZL96_9HYPO|nr:hypothetical protein HIM_04597 [Hirsutella minnesotensis 3608]
MSQRQSQESLLSSRDDGDMEPEWHELRPSVDAKASKALHPAFYIMNWIILSNATIIFNKWIIDSAGFTMLLTCWHLVFAALATQILAHCTSILDSRHAVKMTSGLYLRAICPIGVFYSISLLGSNLVYLYLSVAFIQMLKSAGPISVLLVSWIWRVEEPSPVAFVKICVIVLGVALASIGEIQFSLLGFLLQMASTVFESIRLVLIQVLLGDRKMDPLVGLYYFAPICAAISMALALPFELPQFQWQHVVQTGFGVLFLNAFVAFLLNVAGVFLVIQTPALCIAAAWIITQLTQRRLVGHLVLS